jgi:uncharacterized repeat protein (TIGR03803 family)
VKHTTREFVCHFLFVMTLLSLGADKALASSTKILHTFTAYTHGRVPGPDLVADAGGNLYGTTNQGGAYEVGTVFKLTPSASGAWTESVIYSFKGGVDGAYPTSGLIIGAGGNLYGTLSNGGAGGFGKIYQLTQNADGTWVENVLYSFTNTSDGEKPSSTLVADAAGNLFGTAMGGTIFELSPSAGGWTFQVLYTFPSDGDNSLPGGRLVLDNGGSLYGVTATGGIPCNCGTVYKVQNVLGTWTKTEIYTFAGGTDGYSPVAGLTFDKAGNLYGVTGFGGGSAVCGLGCGTVFKLSPNGDGTWSEKVLHAFNGKDGAFPQAGLTFDVAGNLYGTTQDGGKAGVAFRLTPGAGGVWTESVISAFPAIVGYPGSSVLQANLILDQAGNLYGTTSWGGTADMGTVFKLALGSNERWQKTTLHSFTTSDGAFPGGKFAFDSAGNLYGTTSAGGTYDNGFVFKLAPHLRGTWTKTVLYNFKATRSGTLPGDLIFDNAGSLYGVANRGGNLSCNQGLGCGFIYKLTPSAKGSWTETTLYTFNGLGDGNGPVGRLVFDSAGNLYGATTFGGDPGGSVGSGVVFELSPSASGSWSETTLYKFAGTVNDGAFPTSGVVFDQAGNLYGTTPTGGPAFYGIVFRLSPSSQGQWIETILHNFSGSPADGNGPYQVAFDSAGNLYGATEFGGNAMANNPCGSGCGTVFRLAPASGGQWMETILADFNSVVNGIGVGNSLTFDAAGNLYGVTSTSGNSGCNSGASCSALFKLSPSTGGAWTESIVYQFGSTAGDVTRPWSLTFDATGNLYGTGGTSTPNDGVIFEFAP